jgi:hypothetical protein
MASSAVLQERAALKAELYASIKAGYVHLENPCGSEDATEDIISRLAGAQMCLQHFLGPWEDPQDAEFAVDFIINVADAVLPYVGCLALALAQQCRQQQLQSSLCKAWCLATTTHALCLQQLQNCALEHSNRWLPPLLERLWHVELPTSMPSGSAQSAGEQTSEAAAGGAAAINCESH